MNQRALILGGNGLIGKEMAKLLFKRNFKIIIADISLDNIPTEYDSLYFDVRETDKLKTIIQEHTPTIVINCVNIATIFSTQPDDGYNQLISFFMKLKSSLEYCSVPYTYLHMGTTGSGGLGLDIPFSHGQPLESLPIIHKAAFAGISTALLTLLSRSVPNDCSILEIKPGLAIFDERIHINPSTKFVNKITIDGGESGHYTYNELALLTSFMGFSTVKAITEKAMSALTGKTSSVELTTHNTIEYMNNAIISQSESDKAKRDKILNQMKHLSGKSYLIATGNLGPPAITRDLLLSYLKITNREIDETNFNAETSTNRAISQTMAHIKQHTPNLHDYLINEINYSRFLQLPSNELLDEPWKVVKTILEAVH